MNLYQKMYEKEGYTVAWSFHTAMDLDKAIACHIMELQLGVANEKKKKKRVDCVSNFLKTDAQNTIAFFYDAKKILSNTLSNYQICSQDIDSLIYPLSMDKQTFHAKVSFVCLKRDGDNLKDEYAYRIAVYSRNLTYSNSVLDVGGVFDIEFSNNTDSTDTIAETNGTQFLAFLKLLSEKSGTNWLETKGLTDSGELYERLGKGFHLTNIISNKEVVEIFFGGCGNDKLYKHIGLETMDQDNSIILTPPAFLSPIVNNGINNDEMKAIPLYDLKKGSDFSSSHAKAYLIQKENEPQYSFLFGSANATPRGIGWNIIFGSESGCDSVSVECLIRYRLAQGEFESIKGEVKDIYEKYDFCNGQINENSHLEDSIGEFLAKQKVVDVQLSEENGKQVLHYVIEIESEEFVKEKCKEEFPFYPLEYAKEEKKVTFGEIENNRIVLDYPINGDYKPAQGELIVGTSRRILTVPMELYYDNNLETIKPEESIFDIFLTHALDEENPQGYMNKEIERMNDMLKRINEKLDTENERERIKKMNEIVDDMNKVCEIFSREDSITNE